MNTKIIFIGNYKGGVGKTTSVLNFAEYFSRAEKKVLVLDLDPQSSLSEILVANGNYGSLSDLPENETLNYVFDLYISKIEKYNAIELKFDKAMIKSYKEMYDFVPSSLFYRENMGLDALVLKMKNNIQYLSILKNWIDMVKDKYNFILIDCPPSQNLLLLPRNLPVYEVNYKIYLLAEASLRKSVLQLRHLLLFHNIRYMFFLLY